MAVSGACCVLSAWAYAGPAWALVVFGLVWGASVVADSAQFSASVTELSEPSYMGTALTLQTSLGFALTGASDRVHVGSKWVRVLYLEVEMKAVGILEEPRLLG